MSRGPGYQVHAIRAFAYLNFDVDKCHSRSAIAQREAPPAVGGANISPATRDSAIVLSIVNSSHNARTKTGGGYHKRDSIMNKSSFSGNDKSLVGEN
ncbi:hypothetical protein IAQ61_011176 [Plenodomus lingam]|uniref:uncharacterized protein n=1 Tax=Leptosphaeria maculans TaxID=5022 RepID=UPI00332830B1|nr:hypothetical protein IAQ61_011176 [Plenodomus lingam]